MADVSRNIEREIEAAAAPRGFDIKETELQERTAEGMVIDIILQGDVEGVEIPEDQNTLRVTRSNTDRMFGDRLGRHFNYVKREVLGLDVAESQQLEETRQKLEESGHPGATGDDVEYGPGPRPDTSTAAGMTYDDGMVRTTSTTEADFPEVDDAPEQHTEQSTPSEHGARERKTADPETTTDTDETMTEPSIDTSDLWGKIADTALDGRQLQDKGHDTAAEALLKEIQTDIEEHLGEDE